jgi:hypothetical protein
MKLAVGRCPQSGGALASQSTICRLENAPRKTEAARLCAALIDQFGTSVRPGKLEILDIDDPFCAAHGGQQLAFWNAHHELRGFAPIHIYHVASDTPVVAIRRPARTAKGTEVRCVIKYVTKRLRKHWPNTRIVWRGDGHYGRVEEMERAESDGTDYIFRLAGSPGLDALTAETADNLRFHHAKSNQAKLRKAGSWDRPRNVVARHVDNATANQVRLVLHTAAFWLRHGVRAVIPQTSSLAKAEFATIRERLIKIGARVIEHTAAHSHTSALELS